MKEPIHSVMARLKRNQPRNMDTLRVCDELERAMRELDAVNRRVEKKLKDPIDLPGVYTRGKK